MLDTKTRFYKDRNKNKTQNALMDICQELNVRVDRKEIEKKIIFAN